jgi:cephalosporin-C deacetylase
MPWYDMPLERLREYRTSTQEPDGLDDWWAARAAQAQALASPLTRTPYRPGLYGPVDVDDVEFSGGAGDRIRAWYLRPRDTPGAPVVVKFIGYGGGRGVPAEHVLLPALGYALLVMDTRGQGGRWTTGATPDGGTGTGPENSLVMTRGITRPEDYYYTRLFIDAVRAIDTALELAGPGTATDTPVAVTGGSQGGALALAAAALRPDVVEVCMDDICPPSTVFAAYNEITADKEIAVYPYSDHSCPRGHTERQLAHLSQHLPAS